MWLKATTDPRTGKQYNALWLWLIPVIAAFGLTNASPIFLSINDLWACILPIHEPAQYSIGLLFEHPQTLVGNWGFVLAFFLVSVLTMSEEIIFRGILLPKMNGAFGSADLILFTYELERRLDGTGVTSNCLHPGAVATDGPLKDLDLPVFSRSMYKMVRVFFASPEKGAETSIYLSNSPEVEKVSGKYFIKKTPVASSPESNDEEIARRLWKVSEELTDLVK